MAVNTAFECDVHSDGVLSYWETITCWQLISTDEYILYSLLHDNSATPSVYGACGNMYAVEYATSQPFLGVQTSLSDVRSWDFRAHLAAAMLDMVEAFEDTIYGTLYLCDVQESNFGVVSLLYNYLSLYSFQLPCYFARLKVMKGNSKLKLLMQTPQYLRTHL